MAAIAFLAANVKLSLTLGTLFVPRFSRLPGVNWSFPWLKQFLWSLFVSQLYWTLRVHTGFWIGRLSAYRTNFSTAYWVHKRPWTRHLKALLETAIGNGRRRLYETLSAQSITRFFFTTIKLIWKNHLKLITKLLAFWTRNLFTSTSPVSNSNQSIN